MKLMRVYLGTNIVGSFAFDENGNIIDKQLFPKDPEKIAEKLLKIKNGEIIEEEKKIIENLIHSGYKEIVWDRKKVYKGISCIYKPENIAKEKLREEFRSIALKLKWVSSQAELNEILTKVNIILTRNEIKKQRFDEKIMRAVSVFDELLKTKNIFTEKLKEWYGLHFPELYNVVKNNEQYIKLIAKYGKRCDIKDNEVEKIAEHSAGMDFSDEDIKQIQSLADIVINITNMSKVLEKYIEKIVSENMPNTASIAGPILAGRLLVLAGGLEKMAKMPSSTIQLLGAEKALFRHLREKTKAPKYGILFSHPLVQNAPKDKKGKIARIVASTLSIAARMDYFSKEDKSQTLKTKLESEVNKILKPMS